MCYSPRRLRDARRVNVFRRNKPLCQPRCSQARRIWALKHAVRQRKHAVCASALLELLG